MNLATTDSHTICSIPVVLICLYWLQEGEDPDHVQMVATCKHFIANSLEHSTINGSTITRHNFDAEIPLPELVDYYMPG